MSSTEEKPSFDIDLNISPPHEEDDSKTKTETESSLSIPSPTLILESNIVNNKAKTGMFEALLEVAEIERLEFERERSKKRSEEPIAHADVAVAVKDRRPVRKVKMNRRYGDSFVGEVYVVDCSKRGRRKRRKDNSRSGDLRNGVGPTKRRKKSR